MKLLKIIYIMLLLGYMQVGYGYTHEFVNKTKEVVTVEMRECGKLDVSSLPVSSMELQAGASGKLESPCTQLIVSLSSLIDHRKWYLPFWMRQHRRIDTPKWEISPQSISQPLYLKAVPQGNGWTLDLARGTILGTE